ncbi:DNA adenine methylase [Culicoidibacter larvae]|uniref:DNA adenine methylase n=1 Tax=Culicoidibacter larvae TaxID=2579976 RepID=UPI001484ECFB|nr:DNA adenine methylase [Culicoidibacter larvae]
MSEKVLSPIFRWAGSKKKLLIEMLETFDTKNIYIEPFLGSGVVMSNVLKYKNFDTIYVNDFNSDIIIFYKEVQENGAQLKNRLKEIIEYYSNLNMEEKTEFFYLQRERYNTFNDKNIESACIFWFLMQAGFNGVYRVNSRGEFNVPFGKREKIYFNESNFDEIQRLIENVQFYNQDYIEFLNNFSDEDLNKSFIYLDPPYLPVSASMKNMTMYTKNAFDHKALTAECGKLLKRTDVSIALSIADSELSREIYQTDFFYNNDLAEIIRNVNPQKVLKVKEQLYTSYNL